MILPLIAAAVGADQLFNKGKATDAVGGAIKDFQKVGTNNFQASPYQVQPTYFGGYEGGATDWANIGLKGMGGSNANAKYAQGQMQNQRGPQAFENQELSDREAMSRGWDQAGAMQLAREAAMGQAPSEAAYLMQQGLNQAAANQASLAGSARGAAAIAQAQNTAMGQTAGLQNQAYNQAGALRAQEMANARGLYGGLAGQQREQDQNRLQMGNQMSQFNAGLNDQYRLGMGQLGIGYGNQGLGYYQAAQNPMNQQLQADTQRQGLQADSHNNAQMINAGVSQANADLRRRSRDEVVAMISTMAQSGRGMGGSSMGGK